jgi:hypothetical protein
MIYDNGIESMRTGDVQHMKQYHCNVNIVYPIYAQILET